MADAVMDLTGEDAKDMAAGQRRFHWDKRHKRYVQLQAGEKLRSTGKRKTESGATVRTMLVCIPHGLKDRTGPRAAQNMA